MAELVQFSGQIEARLAAARREPNWQPTQAADFMSALRARRGEFEGAAARLVRAVIKPRLRTLASFFPNAAPDRTERGDRCIYWFGYCERFPADVKVEMAVEHDEPIENLVVHYELYIVPAFLKYDAHDKLTMRLAAVDDEAVARWVETKLLAFLDTYLRLDRGAEDFQDEVVVDPVCGMRISRATGGATIDYLGHPYFFCSDECRQRFAAEPLRYIRFETG
jgi:YHS domain-containing protein